MVSVNHSLITTGPLSQFLEQRTEGGYDFEKVSRTVLLIVPFCVMFPSLLNPANQRWLTRQHQSAFEVAHSFWSNFSNWKGNEKPHTSAKSKQAYKDNIFIHATVTWGYFALGIWSRQSMKSSGAATGQGHWQENETMKHKPSTKKQLGDVEWVTSKPLSYGSF